MAVILHTASIKLRSKESFELLIRMLKDKAERLKETITLLKKLPEVGVARESYVYSQVQDLMTEWINGGGYKKEVIDFESHIGTLTLPIVEGRVSSLDLKVKK